jgi:hypothetical protein
VVIANMPGQSFARTMKAAIFDRFLYCREPGLPRIIHNSRRAGDRVDRHAADTYDTLSFDPVSMEPREQVANFERGSRHECLFPRLVSEVLLRTPAMPQTVPSEWPSPWQLGVAASAGAERLAADDGTASGCGDPAGRRTNLLAAMIRSTKEKTMQKATAMTCIFLHIGGVLLSDGWDHHARKRAATNFKLELAEMEDRHHLIFETYEEGKLTMEEYLGQVVFYRVHPGSVSPFHVRAIEALPRDDRAHCTAQGSARAEAAWSTTKHAN